MTPKGKRSGGPRSAAGKMAVSQNALKSGVYSPSIVLPSEDEAKFRELQEQFIRDFAPADIAESTLIHDLTALVWKKLRVERIETSVLLKTLQEPFKMFEVDQLPGFQFVENTHDVLNIARNESPVAIAAHLAQYDGAERILAEGASAARLAALRKNNPDLYQAFIDAAAEFDEPKAGPKEWMEWVVKTETKADVSFVTVVCQNYLISYPDHTDYKDYKIYQWIHEHYDEVRESLSHHLEARLMQAIQRYNFPRLQDDLSREFSRKLTDFRRHRNWRRERDIITVVPEPVAELSTEAKAAETKVTPRRSRPK
jgi:hypothetical protein